MSEIVRERDVAGNPVSARPMTVQVMKTRAETALSEEFAAAEKRLPGSKRVKELRREAIGAFSAAGLPHRRVEAWKYTDLRNILKDAFPHAHGGVFGSQIISETLDGIVPGLIPGLDAHTVVLVDGALVTGAISGKDGGIEILDFAEALKKPPAWVDAMLGAFPAADGVAALNTAFMDGGVIVRIPDGVEVKKPIHLVFQHSGSEPKAVTTRNIISVGRGASVTLIETHLANGSGARQQNTATQLAIGERARVAHIKNLRTAAGSVHLANWQVEIAAHAEYRPFQMTIGDGLARNQLAIAFRGERSVLDLGVGFILAGRGHADTTLVVDHTVPHCTSRELVKGVLDGASRGVFQGKVIVEPGAQKTDGKQMARALMLSPDAEFDSKPELEIYADDVVCGHGSTSAELDEDLLFYLRSRGIPLREARALLVESFIGEALDKVENDAVREALTADSRRWLGEARVLKAAE